MKNLFKALVVMVAIALPLVITSCSKDEEEGPRTYNYSWLLQGTALGSSATTVERQAALLAEEAVNALFATEFTKRGFTVNAGDQKFSVTTEDDASAWDNKVKQACYTVKGMTALEVAAVVLPADAKIVVKRSGKKEDTTVFNEKLR